MFRTLKWETAMEEAINLAKTQDKPVLLDFFNPG